MPKESILHSEIESLRNEAKTLTEYLRIARIEGWEWDLTKDSISLSTMPEPVFSPISGKYAKNSTVFLDRVHPEDLEMVVNDIYQSIQEGLPFSVEFRYMPDPETQFICHMQGITLLNQSGNPVKMVGTLQDITRLRKTEEALRNSQRALVQAQRVARLGNWEWNIASNKVHRSDELYRIYDVPKNHDEPYEEEEWSWSWSFVHPDDLDSLISKIRSALVSGMLDIEYRVVRSDGQIRIVHEKGEVLYDKEGQPLRMFGTVQDITERKRMEEALRESEAKFRLMAETMLDLIGIIRIDGIIEYASPSHQAIIGYAADEMIGKHVLDLVHPDDIEDSRARFNAVASGQDVGIEKYRYVHKNGHAIYVEARSTAVHDEFGNPKAVVMVARDVTERRKTDEIIQRSDKLSVVGRLAAGMAHEIRNPLASIRGFIQLMQSGELGKPEYCEIILSELDRIELIVSEFLTMAKPQVVSFKPQNLVWIIQQVVLLLNSQAILHNVEIVTDFVADVPSIHCEINQLKQVFVNLIKNAIEAMPTGGQIKIRVAMADDSHVSVRIEDEGQGMSQEQIKMLGEPFYTSKENGLGLGFMVSHKIIENHKGTIRIDSEIGKGTVMKILLPVNPS